MTRSIRVVLKSGEVFEHQGTVEVTIEDGSLFLHDYALREKDRDSGCLVFVAVPGEWLYAYQNDEVASSE